MLIGKEPQLLFLFPLGHMTQIWYTYCTTVIPLFVNRIVIYVECYE
jgi:hypothetical protein